MIVLFYLGALVAILLEFYTIKYPKELYQKLVETDDSTTIDVNSMNYNQKINFIKKHIGTLFLVAGEFIYFFWNIGGFFTFQWFPFLVILLLSLLPKKKLGYKWIFVDGVISLGLIIFIVLNQAHFKIHLF